NAEEFVGRTGIFKLEGNYTFASYLIRLRVNKNSGLLPDYLNIFLNSKFGRKQIHRFSRRAVNQANVNAQELKNFMIALVSLNLQNKIAKLSNAAWQEIKKSRTFYSQAESLLLEELGLKDYKPQYKKTYTAKLSDALSARRLDAEYFQPAYEEVMERIINRGIEIKPLKSFLCEIQKGVEVGSENYLENGKLFLRVSNLSVNGFTDKDQKYISDEIYQRFIKYKPNVGDFLLTKDATPGIAYVVKEDVEGIISSGIVKLKIDEDQINKEYLALCINSIIGKSQVERDVGGSVIIHWRPEQIRQLLIPILPDHIQRQIAELVQKSHQARKKAKELLEIAKRAVEIAIEKSEEEALNFISSSQNHY
ncbi:MAG: restriction endonuclease subunit S, partial [Patescibacteria group bacterium]|nr:restriction endonuclease subunit S [Patescibacteria group bacterium]